MSSVGLEVFVVVADADGRTTGRATPGRTTAMPGFAGVGVAAALADSAGAAAFSETAGGATLAGGLAGGAARLVVVLVTSTNAGGRSDRTSPYARSEPSPNSAAAPASIATSGGRRRGAAGASVSTEPG
ncbi:MAG TPA: hypothetical protein VLM85_29375, partial [Polyangiaceae bacterium]|nr:hypothetical protein [Polyangiaceae bacterium]